MRKVGVVSLVLGALFVACGGDNKKSDQKLSKLDGAPIMSEQGPPPTKDSGGFNADGFGDPCPLNAAEDPCLAKGHQCVGMQGYATGWCTTTCDGADALKACRNMPLPNGTAAWCALTDSTKSTYWCLFICAVGGKTFPCPTGMVCEAAPYDMGAQPQRKCVPNK